MNNSISPSKPTKFYPSKTGKVLNSFSNKTSTRKSINKDLKNNIEINESNGYMNAQNSIGKSKIPTAVGPRVNKKKSKLEERFSHGKTNKITMDENVNIKNESSFNKSSSFYSTDETTSEAKPFSPSRTKIFQPRTTKSPPKRMSDQISWCSDLENSCDSDFQENTKNSNIFSDLSKNRFYEELPSSDSPESHRDEEIFGVPVANKKSVRFSLEDDLPNDHPSSVEVPYSRTEADYNELLQAIQLRHDLQISLLSVSIKCVLEQIEMETRQIRDALHKSSPKHASESDSAQEPTSSAQGQRPCKVKLPRRKTAIQIIEIFTLVFVILAVAFYFKSNILDAVSIPMKYFGEKKTKPRKIWKKISQILSCFAWNPFNMFL